MLTKQAAEKIAQEYYNLGVQYAINQTMNKYASSSSILSKALGKPIQVGSGIAGAGLGAFGGEVAAHHIAELAGLGRGSTAPSELLVGLLAAGGAVPGLMVGLKKAPKI